MAVSRDKPAVPEPRAPNGSRPASHVLPVLLASLVVPVPKDRPEPLDSPEAPEGVTAKAHRVRLVLRARLGNPVSPDMPAQPDSQEPLERRAAASLARRGHPVPRDSLDIRVHPASLEAPEAKDRQAPVDRQDNLARREDPEVRGTPAKEACKEPMPSIVRARTAQWCLPKRRPRSAAWMFEDRGN